MPGELLRDAMLCWGGGGEGGGRAADSHGGTAGGPWSGSAQWSTWRALVAAAAQHVDEARCGRMVGATADQAMLESAEQSANMFPSRDSLATCAQLYFSPTHALLAVCSEMRGQRQIVLCGAVRCCADRAHDDR